MKVSTQVLCKVTARVLCLKFHCICLSHPLILLRVTACLHLSGALGPGAPLCPRMRAVLGGDVGAVLVLSEAGGPLSGRFPPP